ncbi:MAG: hypothetical protein ACNI27_10140 [Desulfovibrio sp.]
MGKILQVRVTASTFDDRDVERAWPKLHELGFGYESAGTPLDSRSKGVLQLVEALEDRLSISMLPENIIEIASDSILKADELRKGIQDALAEWDARTADKLTYELEDLMDDLEQLVKKM